MVGTTIVLDNINNKNTAISRDSYNSGTDTTTMENNITVSFGKTLLSGTTNADTTSTNLNYIVTINNIMMLLIHQNFYQCYL